MLSTTGLSFERTVDVLRAIGEPTRLRVVALLSRGDLTVSDLTSILGQSQPRMSRHLKLLGEAGVVARHQEGAWAYFHLSDDAPVVNLVRAALSRIDGSDALLAEDAGRLDAVRRARAQRAAAYFAKVAKDWDRLRSLHVPDAEVERALLAALGPEPIGALLDVGTGTGRMLELLAPRCGRAVGVDASREMLTIARAKLDAGNLVNASVRQGDAYRLAVEPGRFDLVTIHQVLHYVDDPAGVVREATRALQPGGRLAVVDFAPHSLEFLRDQAHLRLGFSEATLRGYLEAAGLAVEEIAMLAPAQASPNQLTVIVCVARDTRAPATPTSASARLQAVA